MIKIMIFWMLIKNSKSFLDPGKLSFNVTEVSGYRYFNF